MLTKINLEFFKCFEKLKLPVRPLTLLSGTNASGKSTVFQALVLLHQTMREHEWSTRLMLNGSSIKLGTVADVVDEIRGRHHIVIGIVYDEKEYVWQLEGQRPEMSMAVEMVNVRGRRVKTPRSLRYLLPRHAQASNLTDHFRRLSYLTAERVGPREVYSLEDRQIAVVVGPQGEHTASVLEWGRDEKVVQSLCVNDTVPTLLRQVEARMRMLFPGFTMEVRQIPGANAVTLGLRTSDATGFHRPTNAGFGLTQVLPIIVAALSAQEGDIILVENPEVHLHPAGQALMGMFLAEVANADIQVIIETHSDHVLNGVRRAVKEGMLPAEKAAVHFFRPRSSESEGLAQVVSPILDSRGNIDKWPDGFFDQFDKDMNFFADWGA